MAGARVKIQQTGASPRCWRVWVEDQELTKFCRWWVVEGAIDDVTLLSLGLAVQELDVEVIGFLAPHVLRDLEEDA